MILNIRHVTPDTCTYFALWFRIQWPEAARVFAYLRS